MAILCEDEDASTGGGAGLPLFCCLTPFGNLMKAMNPFSELDFCRHKIQMHGITKETNGIEIHLSHY